MSNNIKTNTLGTLNATPTTAQPTTAQPIAANTTTGTLNNKYSKANTLNIPLNSPAITPLNATLNTKLAPLQNNKNKTNNINNLLKTNSSNNLSKTNINTSIFNNNTSNKNVGNGAKSKGNNNNNNNNKAGFAECVPYKRYGETQEKIFSI